MTTNKTRHFPRGYTMWIAEQVAKADQTLVGVQLANFCIKNGIPATKVAQDLGVSKPTVYAWFVGRFHPSPPQAEKVATLIEAYTATGAGV